MNELRNPLKQEQQVILTFGAFNVNNHFMEHEITGHSRKVYKIWKNPAISFWSKFREIGIEVLIIVFAVSLAAYLERKREHSSEQKEVKAFLSGLKTDLLRDIEEMKQDKKTYLRYQAACSYFAGIKPGEHVSKDSIDKYYGTLLNTTGLLVNDGRYQGFKSSGKINTIENGELQNDILDLYQEDIPALLASSNYYSAIKQILLNYLLENIKRNPDGSNNIATVLTTEKAYNTISLLAYTQNILHTYDIVIDKSRKIIETIDHEYQ
jgi:hypothetical protein